MSPSFDRAGLSTRLIAGAALTGALVLGFAAPAAADPAGDNGTVKIHDPSTPEEDNRNEPKVCDFQVVASGFDSVQEVSWKILTQGGPPGSRTVELAGELVLDQEGAGSTETLSLDDGHYRLEWTFEGQRSNAAKHKVFKVVCEDPEATPSPAPTDPPVEPSDEPEEPEETETPGDDETSKDEEPPGVEDGPSEEETEPAGSKTDDEPVLEQGAEESEGGLAVTGSALVALVAAGAVAAAGGGGALYLSRKRRGVNGTDV